VAGAGVAHVRQASRGFRAPAAKGVIARCAAGDGTAR
jgi:hypothetical protein